MASTRIRLWPKRIDDGTEMKLLDVGQFTEFSLKNEKRKGEKKISFCLFFSLVLPPFSHSTIFLVRTS